MLLTKHLVRVRSDVLIGSSLQFERQGMPIGSHAEVGRAFFRVYSVARLLHRGCRKHPVVPCPLFVG
jgi:hypothetical protein